MLTYRVYIDDNAHILPGHSLVYGVVIGTNQGGVLAYSIDMPPNKHRENKSPILMPIGE